MGTDVELAKLREAVEARKDELDAALFNGDVPLSNGGYLAFLSAVCDGQSVYIAALEAEVAELRARLDKPF